ncbi:MAG: sugar phosphate isomerase/epimerase [Actinocatenispora sp.]
MRFAVFTASLPDWTPEEAVAELVDAGYDGVEWRVTDQQPSADGTPGFWAGNRCTWPFATLAEDLPRIAEVTSAAGLAMPSLGTYVRCGDPAAVDAAMAAAATLGVPQLRVTVPPYDPRDSYRAVWQQCRGEYAEVAQLAARHGVRALVEIHHRTPVQSPHAAASFVDGLDPAHVGVIHDVGNMVYEGWSDYRLGLEVLGDHLAHVHLKNGRWAREGERPDGTGDWRAGAAPLRDGIVDVTALFVALRQVGYDRWVTFEDFSTERPLRERIRDNLALTRQAYDTAQAG